MKITDKKSEVERLIRSVKLSAEKLAEGNPENRYIVNFGMALAQPKIDQSISEVKSFLEALNTAIKQFSGSEVLSVQLDVQHANGFDANLLKETRSAYEESKKIEEAAQPKTA